MTDLRRRALASLPLSEATVQGYYELPARPEAFAVHQCLKALCASHERLRAELQGAQVMLADADKLRDQVAAYQCDPLYDAQRNAGADLAAQIVLDALAGRREGELSEGPLRDAVAGVEQLRAELGYSEKGRASTQDALEKAIAYAASNGTQRDKFRALLAEVMEQHDEPCNIDRNGFCQSHLCRPPCLYARIGEAL